MLGKVKEYLRQKTAYGRSRYLNFLYRYDMKRYFAHSGMEQQDAEVIAARIRLLVHTLEKGLSVKDQKPEFGREKVKDLLKLLEEYRACPNDPDPQAVLLGKAVIGSWARNRVSRGEDVSFLPEELRDYHGPAGAMAHSGGTSGDFAEIARNRHSIRAFSQEPVSEEVLTAAVALAQTAPSACNRQATHVFACVNEEKIRKIVERHGGLRGFSNLGAVLVVTGDLRLYQSEYERNTVFVDGGIFLMNLLYALETQGLGACPIIWGAEPDNDKFLYELLGIPEQHEIVSLIVCGHYPDGEIKVPCSARRETAEMFHYIG